MSYHSSLDYSCKNCGENFLPFKSSMYCPKCGTLATEESSIIQETIEALAMHGYEHPGVYGVFSLGDSYILFASEVAENVKPNDEPKNLAQKYTKQMEEGYDHLQEHFRKFLEEILPTVIKEKFEK